MTKENQKVKSRKFQKNLFIILMLAYPILQFALFFGYVNIDTILLTFKKFSWTTGDYVYAGFSNYQMVFDRMFNDAPTKRTLLNSLMYMPVNSLIILPLSIVFSYLLYKKVPMSGAFRVIYFLPSILPIVVLTMVFSFNFDSNLGPINDMFRFITGLFGNSAQPPSWFGKYPNNQMMIFVYCIWAGLGFNILLLSSSITRIPRELIEYGKIEGISFWQEFIYVIIPMIWPTIVTTFMLGMTATFTVMLQPLLLTPTSPDTNTIALLIYNSVLRNENLSYTATFGIIVSLLGLPIILLVRNFMNRFFKEVEY